MVIHEAIVFKSVHPFQYGIRLLCLSFSMVFIGLWLSSGEGEAATLHTFDIDTATDDLCYGWADPMMGVCPSNRWYVPYIGQGDLNISWSDDNGTSWTDATIVSDGWKGETHMSVVSIQTWSNNTTCVLVRTQDADHAYDLYLFWLWGENDPSDSAAWNYTSFADYISPVRFASMVFNQTGHLYCVWLENNAIRSSIWDISTGTFGSDDLWLSISGYPSIQCDHNNNVWVSYQSGSNLWCKSWDKVVSIQKSGMTYFDLGSFFITGDNTKVWTGHYQYLSNHAKAVVYESVTNTTLTSNTFASNTDDWDTSYWSGGNVHGLKTVSVVLLRQESGSEEYVEFKAEYDAIDATWEASETVLWTIPTSTDAGYHYGNAPNAIWPKMDGNNSINRMTSGRCHYWLFKDEQGAPDDWYDLLYLDSPTFPWWNWSAPAVPGPGNATTNETDYNWTWWGDASCITSFMIIGVVLLVGIIIVQATTARRS